MPGRCVRELDELAPHRRVLDREERRARASAVPPSRAGAGRLHRAVVGGGNSRGNCRGSGSKEAPEISQAQRIGDPEEPGGAGRGPFPFSYFCNLLIETRRILLGRESCLGFSPSSLRRTLMPPADFANRRRWDASWYRLWFRRPCIALPKALAACFPCYWRARCSRTGAAEGRAAISAGRGPACALLGFASSNENTATPHPQLAPRNTLGSDF